MELTPEDVQEILRILEQSSFDELYLETPQLKLIVRRGQGTGTAVPAPPANPVQTAETRSEPPRAMPVSEATAQAAPPTATPDKPAPATTAADRLIPISAPLKGIFYRAPRPGAPPFVDVGSSVQEDTVVGIIEVMKLMHSVLAGVRGEIVEVCAENGQAVDRGQPLFLVRPSEDASVSSAPDAS